MGQGVTRGQRPMHSIEHELTAFNSTIEFLYCENNQMELCPVVCGTLLTTVLGVCPSHTGRVLRTEQRKCWGMWQTGHSQLQLHSWGSQGWSRWGRGGWAEPLYDLMTSESPATVPLFPRQRAMWSTGLWTVSLCFSPMGPGPTRDLEPRFTMSD